jgi:hypothetical protein
MGRVIVEAVNNWDDTDDLRPASGALADGLLYCRAHKLFETGEL